MELTILIPCLNEAETLDLCILRAKQLLEGNRIDGEILISDNGSTDGSQEIAKKNGVRVVDCPVKGYGSALQFGIERAQGQYILIWDADNSYHFDEAIPMIQKLREGYDVCMGTRLKGTIMPNAMPFLNRYLGNPALSRIGKILFSTKLSDYNCGMRAFKRDLTLEIGIRAIGMEWCSEQIIKSTFAGAKITEVPIVLYKDGRSRPPHMRPWRDGWRNLKFMLLHAPTWLFIVPSITLILTAVVFGGFLVAGPVKIGKANLDIHTLLLMYGIIVLGTQALFAGLFVNLYGHLNGILPVSNTYIQITKILSLEKLLTISLILGLAGFSIFGYHTLQWIKDDFPDLEVRVMMRQFIPALTMMTLSGQCIFNGFMLSTLFINIKGRPVIFSDWN
jgi:glycosyltransferase involved in cell wall biosynthesis